MAGLGVVLGLVLLGARPGPAGSAPRLHGPVELLGGNSRSLAVVPGPAGGLLVISGGRLLRRRGGAAGPGRWEVLSAGPGRSGAGGGAEGAPDPAAVDGDPPVTAGAPQGPVALVPLSTGVAVGRARGVEIWDLRRGRTQARRHRLDGRPATALAVGAGGRWILVGQGRWLWRGEGGRFSRLARSPEGTWRHLAGHPRQPGWVLALAGASLWRSTTGGRRWERLPGSPRGETLLREARFTGCPRSRGARSPGSGVLLRSADVVSWLLPGGRRRRLVPPVPPRALLEADPADPAVYVAADRLYRWPCAPGSEPEALPVPTADLVALARDPRRPGRLWLLGRRGLRRFEVGGGRSGRPGRGHRSPRPALRRRPGGAGRPRGGAACLGAAAPEQAVRREWGRARPGPGPRRRLPRVAWLPRLSLGAVGLAHRRAARWRRLTPRLGRRRRPGFRILLTLRWPLEVPTPALIAEAGGRAVARRAAQGRRLRRLVTSCPAARGPLARWAAAAEREAVERFFRRPDTTARGPARRKEEIP